MMRFIVVLVCLLMAAATARGEVISGTYVGDGSLSRQITGVGFQPEAVIVKGNVTQPAMILTSTLPAGQSKQLAQDQPLFADRILDLTADGFEIGSHASVNATGVTYAWVAFSSSPGELTPGNYTGNGAALQDVTGLGFQPELVFVLPANGSRPCWRNSAMPASQSMPFDDVSLRTGLISGFAVDGFQVGSDTAVNQSGVVYHYLAWNSAPGTMSVGTYAGDGASTQDIAGLAFKPEWVLVKIGDNDLPAVIKPRGLGGSESGFVTPQVFTTQGIQDVLGFGFRVGSDPAVNNDGHPYYYAAFDENPGNAADLAIAITADSASPPVGQDVVYTVTLSNIGPDNATTVAATVILPPELTYASHVAGLGTYNGVTGIWTVGNLNVGASSALTVTARLDAGIAGQDLTTTAAVSGSDLSDPSPANNTATATVTVAASDADLAVGLAVDDTTPDALQPLVYTVTVTNQGPGDAGGVRVQLAAPPGVQLDQSAWDVGNLTSGASVSLDVPGLALAGTAGQVLTVSAAIAATDQPDPVAANDTATVDVLVASSDLVLALSTSDSTPSEGQLVTFTATLANAGPDPNANILVGLDWPAGLVVQGHTADAGTYDDVTAGWSLAALASGATVTLQMQAMVGAATGGTTLTTTANVDGAARGDPVVSNNAAAASLTVSGPSTLQVRMRPFGVPRRQVLPGGAAAEVLRIDVINTAAVIAPLSAITVHNPPAQDGAWAGLDLRYREGAAAVPVPTSGGAPAGVFVAGSLTFGDLDLAIAPGDTLHLTVFGVADLGAADGLELTPHLADANDLVVTGLFTVAGAWPLAADGILTVDGMTAAQITLHPVGAEVFQLGSVRNVAFDVTLPGNGGQPDQLTRFNVRNHGTATPGDVLTALELWGDDGDGSFDAAADTRIAPLTWTGDRWEATGLAHAVPADGLRLMVTADVAGDALGGTVMLGLPAGDDTGVGMASGNDGPIDEPVVNPFAQTVSATDRVIVTTATVASTVVAPGQADVLVMHLLARNLYADPRSLTRLQVRNAGNGGDTAVSGLKLRQDGNGDGVLGSIQVDPVVGTAEFAAGRAVFAGLDCPLTPGAIAHLFLTADVSLTTASDGDSLAVVIGSGSDLDFDDSVALVGAWPLDSRGRHRVDGMVAAQIERVDVPPVSLTAGEGPVLAFDFTIPGNGLQADTLTELRLTNEGSASVTDIDALQLWADDGNGVFQPSLDTLVSDLAGVGATWVAPDLDLAVPANGRRLFASLTVSGAPADSATVRLGLPVNGIEVESANDGPRDATVASPTSLLISTAPLLSSLQIVPARSTVGQLVTVTMHVTNVSGETVNGIAPHDVVVGGDGALTLVSGPTPASLDLDSGASGTLSWTGRADAAGAIHVQGYSSGIGAVGGQPRLSLATASGGHRILNPALPLTIYPVANLPFSINRGQAGVVPLTLTLINTGDESTAEVRLTRLVMTLDDGEGNPVVPADLLSRVLVNEGVDIYGNLQQLPASGQTVTLDLAPYAVVTSREPVTVSLRLDIRPDTEVRRFRVRFLAAPDITVLDHVSLSPVTPVLSTGSFPIASGTGLIVAQATGLALSLVPTASATAGVGQDQVELLHLDLHGTGDPAFPTDVKIGSFAVALIDTLGQPLRDASALLQRLRVVGSLGVHAEAVLDDPADSVITFQLMPPVTVPVGDLGVALRIYGRIPAGAELGSLRLRLQPTSTIDARDGNVGVPVPVSFTPSRIEGPVVTIQARATDLTGTATPRLPTELSVGATGVPALTIHLAHMAGETAAAVVLDTLRMVCLDGNRQPLDPSGISDRLRVTWRGLPCADLSPPTAADGVIRIPLTGVGLAAGEAGDLDLFCDLEAVITASGFELVMPDSGLVAHDANLQTVVSLRPGPRFTTGFARLVAASDELLVRVIDRMPPMLAGDGIDVEVAQVVLRNGASPGSGPLLVQRLTMRGDDRDLAATCAGFTARIGELTWSLAVPDSVVFLGGETPLTIAAGEEVVVSVMASFLPAATGSLRLGLMQADVHASHPDGASGAIRVRPAPGVAFPFWTQTGHFSGLDLAASYINYPNPFAAGRESTCFAFSLAQDAEVSLRIITARGESVVTLLDRQSLAAGLHQDLTWDGRNGRDQAVHNGVYIAQLEVWFADGGQERVLRKVAVVR